jgi:hypothetical protein
MSQAISTTTRARFADLALAVYLAPLLKGRRVAVVGTTSGEVCRRVRTLGAQVVISFGGVGDDIAVRALVPGALQAMRGKLDVVLVPDASQVPSLVAVLDEARHALGSAGVVAVGAHPNSATATLEAGPKSALELDELEELCAARFGNVHLLGRGPFVGYAIASLFEAPDGLDVDTRLIDGDPPMPEAFVAIASDAPVALSPFVVVQLPHDVIGEVRAQATKGLEEEIARHEQKLKELEAASAERWVKIQRYEHGLKELEDENRKARDKAVRLSKELEDERKLRQRIELDAQMSRRAPELPKTPDFEPELRSARADLERLAAEVLGLREVERTAAAAIEVLRAELTEARTVAARANARVADLERELDETQTAEADLRAQLDEALERAEVIDRGPEVEALLARIEVLQGELLALRGGAVDPEFARIEALLAQQAVELTRAHGDRVRAEESVRELALSLSRSDMASEELAELRSRLATMASVHAALADRADAVAHENDMLRARLASAAQAPAGVDLGAVEAQERARQESLAARAEVTELTAQNIGLEARLVHTAMELEGARAGYARRVAELEREVDRLVRALEVAASQTEFDREASHEHLTREVALTAAEREGVMFRSAEAERALLSTRARTTQEIARLQAALAEAERRLHERVVAVTSDVVEPSARVDRVLEDLSATAERLANTEEELARRNGDVEALVTQLADRDHRLAQLERRREEELSGAQHSLALEAQGNRTLRTTLDAVRSGLSTILVDGRGAMVAPDLMALLRRIDETH